MKKLLLHLFLIDDIGSITIQKIIKNTKSDTDVSAFYSFSESDWMHYYGITYGAAQKIVTGLANKKMLDTELYLIDKHDIKWMSILDDSYPALLREIYMPPAVLYYRGGNFDDAQKHIAVVGSRACNAYGSKIISAIVPELVASDIVIVSGGALGIDALAHEAAVKNGGKTIAVLGSGLLKEYPASNKKVFASIVEHNGLMVGIFPLLCEPLSGNFPARNRVIAGLSQGCLVVQAAQKSGALITARFALEQGRDVFAVPGAIDDPLSVGCHELIQQGAKLVMSGVDIAQEMGCSYTAVRDIQKTLYEAQQLSQELPQKKLSDVQQKIVHICVKPASLDEIIQETGLELAVVQSELFDMHVEGLIEQDFIGMWTTTHFFQ